MSVQNCLSRRSFLKATGAVAAGMALSAKGYAAAAGANDRLNIGVIGCGGISQYHRGGLLKMRQEENIDILAVCDVWDKRASDYADVIKKAGGNPKVFHDYHDILAIKDIDYVLIATPEHAHAHITLDALDAGKHVYCEKPVTHTIEEAKKVVAKVKETGLKLQVGVQGTSDSSYQAAHEAILAGKLGPVVEAQIEYARNYRDHGPWREHGAKDSDPKPADLDWERWLGPAPKRPWNARRYNDWRCYRDYSGGISTDLFVHRLTRIIKSCGLEYPELAAGLGGIFMWDDGREMPDSLELLLQYPKKEGITPGMTVHLLGTMANDHPLEHCIRGHDATLVFTPTGWDIIDEKKQPKKVLESYQKTGAEDAVPHHKNHHAAIRSGAPLNCPVDVGMYAVAAVCMGNESWFSKKMMRWDSEKQNMVPA